MSKNHTKELKGIYKRCLSSLNQSYKTQQPNGQKFSKLIAIAKKEASKKSFESVDKKNRWIECRISELHSEALVKANLNPNGQLMKQIEEQMAHMA